MSDFNYNKGRHCPLVVGFNNHNSPHPSLAILYATKPGCPPYSQIWKDNASQSNNTGGGSQKQVGDRQSHGRLLCGWGYYHSIFELWSDNQYCLQGGYHTPCHSWQHPILHMPGFHENILSCIGERK